VSAEARRIAGGLRGSRRAAAALGVIASIAYLLNLGFGIWPEIPDTLPLVGNLDEAAATALLLWCVRELSGRPHQPPSV
jgi:uncharacterized membrane protein YkvA (DUF1232 family)